MSSWSSTGALCHSHVRMLVKGIFNIIVNIIQHYCATPKEILCRLFNPFNLKVLDLYLEPWFTREWIYGITGQHTL